LSYNLMENEGATSLATSLMINTTLERLNIVQNDIFEKGGIELSEALK